MSPAIFFLSAALSATISPQPVVDNGPTVVTLFTLADLFPESKPEPVAAVKEEKVAPAAPKQPEPSEETGS
jgi:hypothetical protein